MITYEFSGFNGTHDIYRRLVDGVFVDHVLVSPGTVPTSGSVPAGSGNGVVLAQTSAYWRSPAQFGVYARPQGLGYDWEEHTLTAWLLVHDEDAVQSVYAVSATVPEASGADMSSAVTILENAWREALYNNTDTRKFADLGYVVSREVRDLTDEWGVAYGRHLVSFCIAAGTGDTVFIPNLLSEAAENIKDTDLYPYEPAIVASSSETGASFLTIKFAASPGLGWSNINAFATRTPGAVTIYFNGNVSINNVPDAPTILSAFIPFDAMSLPGAFSMGSMRWLNETTGEIVSESRVSSNLGNELIVIIPPVLLNSDPNNYNVSGSCTISVKDTPEFTPVVPTPPEAPASVNLQGTFTLDGSPLTTQVMYVLIESETPGVPVMPPVATPSTDGAGFMSVDVYEEGRYIVVWSGDTSKVAGWFDITFDMTGGTATVSHDWTS